MKHAGSDRHHRRIGCDGSRFVVLFAPRKAFRARVGNGVQESVVEVKGGYSPAVIEAEAGLPLRLIFDRKEDGECSSHVVFSDFGVDLALPPFRTTTLTIHPDEPGSTVLHAV